MCSAQKVRTHVFLDYFFVVTMHFGNKSYDVGKPVNLTFFTFCAKFISIFYSLWGRCSLSFLF